MKYQLYVILFSEVFICKTIALQLVNKPIKILVVNKPIKILVLCKRSLFAVTGHVTDVIQYDISHI